MSDTDRLRLVLASNNAGKLAELQALFAPLPLDLVAQPSLGLAEAEEPHPTFIENAMASNSSMNSPRLNQPRSGDISLLELCSALSASKSAPASASSRNLRARV